MWFFRKKNSSIFNDLKNAIIMLFLFLVAILFSLYPYFPFFWFWTHYMDITPIRVHKIMLFSQCLRFYKWHLLISYIIQVFPHKHCKHVKIFSKATNFYNIIIVTVIIIETPYNNALYLNFFKITLHMFTS